jgi:hypothetical protein
MSKHHIIISGTGRAGTTFLVQLFTVLGFDTGFNDISAVSPHSNAGMEWDIRIEGAPHIIKSPWLCDYLDDVLEESDIVIDHAIIPIRHLGAAAESRRDVSRRTDKNLYPGDIPGGLWHTNNPHDQDAILAGKLYKIVFTLAKRDIPMTLLHFPRFIHDPEFLYRKIGATLQGMKYERFLEAFLQVARPDLIHVFHQDVATELGVVVEVD